MNLRSDGSRWILSPAIRRGLAAALILAGLLAAPRASAAGPSSPGFELLRSDARGITVSYQVPAHRIVEREIEGSTYQAIELPGGESFAAAGSPDLPSVSVFLGIPANVTPRLRSTATGTQGIDLPLRPPPVPEPRDDLDPNAPMSGSQERWRYREDPLAYAGSHTRPAQAATIAETGWIRDQRYLRLVFHPFRYTPDVGLLEVHGELLAEIELLPLPGPVAVDGGRSGEVDAAPRRPGSPLDSIFDEQVRALLLNSVSAGTWRADPLSVTPPVANEPPSERGPVWNLHVADEGMQRVTGAELEAAGLPIGVIDPRRLQLYLNGEAVDLYVEGEGDAILAPTDALVFYGQAPNSRFTTTQVYQLAYESDFGKRMRQRSAAPTGAPAIARVNALARFEENERYVSDRPRYTFGSPSFVSTLDRWYWRQINAPGVFTDAALIDAPAPGDWTGELRLRVLGKSYRSGAGDDHAVKVSAGGQVLGERGWDGAHSVETLSFPLPAALLTGGVLDLRIEALQTEAAGLHQFYLDNYELAYQRSPSATDGRLLAEIPAASGSEDRDLEVEGLSPVTATAFDVTETGRPERLTDLGGSSAARLRVEGAGARKILALEPSGYVALSRIEARPQTYLRRPEGSLSVVMIGPEVLLDAAKPLADHRNSQGLSTLRVALQQVYDAYAGGQTDPEAIRAFLSHAHSHWELGAVLLVGDGSVDPKGYLGGSRPSLVPPYLKVADPWLGEIASDNAYAAVAGDDLMPDLLLGRLPVNSPDEAQAMVQKILNYETAAPAGDWRERLIFAADEIDPRAANFHALSDAIADEKVPEAFDVTRIYLGEHYENRRDARDAIVAAFESGALVSQYIGHGRTRNWSVDNIFSRSDVVDLTNGSKLPVMLEMTCMTGRFQEHQSDAITEAALRNPGGGAIAAFAPTGFGVATGHDPINRAFMEAMLSGGTTRVGAAALAGKLALFGQGGLNGDLLETFVLLGDPLLVVQTPEDLATPTASPSPSPTATATATATVTASASPTTAASTPTTTASASQTPTTNATATSIAEPSATSTTAPSGTPTSQPSVTATASDPTPGPTSIPSATPNPDPSATLVPTSAPSATQTPTQTVTPTATPSATALPSSTPTATAAAPSSTPFPPPFGTARPSATPPPTLIPSATATPVPTATLVATVEPSPTSNLVASATPSRTPGSGPTDVPAPSATPSGNPGSSPTPNPGGTESPTVAATAAGATPEPTWTPVVGTGTGTPGSATAVPTEPTIGATATALLSPTPANQTPGPGPSATVVTPTAISTGGAGGAGMRLYLPVMLLRR